MAPPSTASISARTSSTSSASMRTARSSARTSIWERCAQISSRPGSEKPDTLGADCRRQNDRETWPYIFSQSVPQRRHIEHLFGEEFLKAGILVLQRLQPPGVRDLHAAVALAPGVELASLTLCLPRSPATPIPAACSFRSRTHKRAGAASAKPALRLRRREEGHAVHIGRALPLPESRLWRTRRALLSRPVAALHGFENWPGFLQPCAWPRAGRAARSARPFMSS